MRNLSWLAVVGCGVWLVGCSREDSSAPATTSTAAVEASPSLAALNHGAQLFQQHCAQCHGPEGQGHPDWQTPGVVAAPPLNGTGNDWKRSRAELIAIIRDGAKRNGTPVMPAWKGRLSETEVDDLIAWFQALWPPEVYSQWQRSNTARAGVGS